MNIYPILADFEASNSKLSKTIANMFKLKGIESGAYTAQGACYLHVGCGVFDTLKVIKLVGFDTPEGNDKVLCKKDMYAVSIDSTYLPSFGGPDI